MNPLLIVDNAGFYGEMEQLENRVRLFRSTFKALLNDLAADYAVLRIYIRWVDGGYAVRILGAGNSQNLVQRVKARVVEHMKTTANQLHIEVLVLDYELFMAGAYRDMIDGSVLVYNNVVAMKSPDGGRGGEKNGDA